LPPEAGPGSGSWFDPVSLSDLPAAAYSGDECGPDEPGPSSIDVFAEQGCELPPGPEALNLLTATPPQLLSEATRLRVLRGLDRVAAYVEAQRLAVIATISGPRAPLEPGEVSEDFVGGEIAVALGVPLPAADRQVALARDLGGRLRPTAGALEAGDLSARQASAVHTMTAHLPDDAVNEVQDRVMPRAGRQSAAAFTRLLRRAVVTCDPEFTARAAAARSEVQVWHEPLTDGTGELTVRAPLEVTTIVHQALKAYAHASRDILGGTKEQRMAVCLRDWAETYLASPGAPTEHGRPPTVEVTVSLDALLGLTGTPAEIIGVGPVPASVARWLLIDGAPYRRLVTDPHTGGLLDYGRTRYTVPRDVVDHLAGLHRTSVGPISQVRARACDIDHVQPWDRGGTTEPGNLTPLDRRWHRAKTLTGWSYTKARDGTVTWTSPKGQKCQVPVYDYRE
jgi:hypothetical protein